MVLLSALTVLLLEDRQKCSLTFINKQKFGLNNKMLNRECKQRMSAKIITLKNLGISFLGSKWEGNNQKSIGLISESNENCSVWSETF